MTRKEAIQAQAQDHAKRGIFDNAMCRSGFERSVYAQSWES
jgi:hypothetical protein